MKCPRCGSDKVWFVPSYAAIGAHWEDSLNILSIVDPSYDHQTSLVLSPAAAPLVPLKAWFSNKFFRKDSMTLAIHRFRSRIWNLSQQMRQKAVYCPDCNKVICGSVEESPYNFNEALKLQAIEELYSD